MQSHECEGEDDDDDDDEDEDERFLEDELDLLLLALDSPRYGCITWFSFHTDVTQGSNFVKMVHSDSGVAANCAQHCRCHRLLLRVRRRRELLSEDGEEDEEDNDNNGMRV